MCVGQFCHYYWRWSVGWFVSGVFCSFRFDTHIMMALAHGQVTQDTARLSIAEAMLKVLCSSNCTDHSYYYCVGVRSFVFVCLFVCVCCFLVVVYEGILTDRFSHQQKYL